MTSLHKSVFFKNLGDKKILCQLCPRSCIIFPGKFGYCHSRQNINGILYSVNYGKICSINIDPIEKKPIFHFAPGSSCLSLAVLGCNLGCGFCQNWPLSHPEEGQAALGYTPKEIVNVALNKKTDGIAYTYTEPTIGFEFFFDTMKLAHGKGLYNVWVTNGYICPEPIKKISPYLDAVNIDYKGDDNFYKKLCEARLGPVRKAMLEYHRNNVPIEITNLLIPGENDSKEIILEMVEWISKNLGKETPLHFSAYHPDYKMSVPSTPVKTIEKAMAIADEHLDYVYAGNVRSTRESTFCPSCKSLLIKRSGFFIDEFNLKKIKNNFHCPGCKKEIPIKGCKTRKPIRVSRISGIRS